MRNWLLYLLLIMLSVASCARKPDGDQGKISEPGKTRNTPERNTYKIDTATSIVTWEGSRNLERHNGIFKIKEGSIIISRLKYPVDSQEVNIPTIKDLDQIDQAHVTINVNSMDILDLIHDQVQYKKLLRYLKSEDFLQTSEYPEATFELTSIEKIDKDTTAETNDELTIIDPTHRIKGNLTIRGITKSIEFPVRLGLINLKLEASAKFNIDRTAWGIDIPDDSDKISSTRDDRVNNIVNVGFEIIAYLQEP
jgi:polyisoprenoid-binding protein YceI